VGKLILAVRSHEKGLATKERILSAAATTTATGRDVDPSRIMFLVVDLSSFASVVSFCKELHTQVGDTGLDAALLCAGVAPPSYKAVAAGNEEGTWDVAVQVNILSTTLMAEMLLPLLQRRKAVSPTSFLHLTFVNSTGNDMVKPEWLAGHDGSALRIANDPQAWSAMRTYAVVKLVGLAVMMGMAERILRKEVIINAVCPGLCKTDLGRDYPWITQALMAPVQLFLHRTAEEGARSLVSATALGPESHGKFWHNGILYPVSTLFI